MTFHFVQIVLMFSLLNLSSLSGLPSSVPVGTSFSTVQPLCMESQNGMFQVEFRSWGSGVDQQCMGGVRYRYKTANALIWSFNEVPQPLNGSDCTLTLRSDGILVLQLIVGASSSRPVVAWETPTAGLRVQSLHLQDDGNLVLLDQSGRIMWQSFSYFRHLFLIPSGMKFFQNMTLYDRVQLPWYSDFNMPGCYALQMGSQGHLLLLTRANRFVYHSIGITTSTSSNGAVPNYIVIQKDIEFYSSQGTLMGSIAHNVLNDDPLPNVTNLIGSALFSGGNLLINHPNFTDPDHHLWYYNSSISNFCDFPLVCGEYGLCNETTRECSCPLGFQITFKKPACTAQLDEATRKCSCPEEFPEMPKFNSTCVPVDPAYSLHPINVSFRPQPSAKSVVSQAQCRTLCEQNASCNAALFDSSDSSCALFSILYTIALPSQNTERGQVMFLKINASNRSSRSTTAIIVSATIVGATLILIIVFLVARRWWWHHHHIHIQAQERFLQELSKLPPRFSYKDLQAATNDFSKRLGMGGYGSVYEGVLNTPTGIAKVAVKRLDQAEACTQYTMDDQFKAEVATIGSVSHVNLVTLKGFCMEKNARLLVFEFMPRASLDRWLYEPHELLNWDRRCCIALDTAKGLEYLHHQSAEHIVHCDVKPGNILLDEDFHAKVGDFGLAKLMGRDNQSFAMTTMKGTRGYLAPEWLQNATITAKSDVYSYGVVLLQLITGKRSLDPEYGHLPTWVMKTVSAVQVSGTSTSTPNSTTLDFDAMDASRLQDTIMDDHLPRGSVPTARFKRVLILALACVQAEPGDRPSMASVVQTLEDILEISYSQPTLKPGRYSFRASASAISVSGESFLVGR